MSDVLTVEDVAAELRCGASTVYALVHSGELVSFRIGKRGIRVTKAALEAFKAEPAQGRAS